MRFSPLDRSRGSAPAGADANDDGFDDVAESSTPGAEPGAAGPSQAPYAAPGDATTGPVTPTSPADGQAPGARPGGQFGAPGSPGPPLPVIVPRWIQLVLLPLALLGLWALARASGSVLLILVIASVVAIILNPIVRAFERVLPRGLAILAVFVGGFAILAGVGVLLSNPIGSQVDRFADHVPQLTHQANHSLDNLQRWLNRNGIKIQIEHQGQTALDTLQKRIVKSSGSIVSFSRDLLGQIVTVGFDFVLILVLTVYLLAYARQIGDTFRRIMPAGDGTPADDYPLLIQRAVSGYVRGQCLFSLIMGTSATLALWILGVTGVFPAGSRYALFFGAFYGLMEFIPYIGPVIGPVPAVVVALFTDPISAIWVTLMFVALQQLEGHVVAPQVFRISLRINPILIILSLLIGYQLYGIVGALVSLPLASIVRQTLVYLRRHLVFEPWTLNAAGGSVLQLTGAQCTSCGAEVDPQDAYCRGCGAPSSGEISAQREKS